MHRHLQFTLIGLTATALFVACEQSTTRDPSHPSITDPSFTLASGGFASTTVARGSAEAFDIRSSINGFDVEIKTKGNTDIAVSNVVVPSGGSSGWHSHPGPVLVVVKTGTITFYRAGNHGGQNGDDEHHGRNAPKCTRTDYPAGSAFVEVPAPGHVMLAKNEGSIEATVTATYFAPPGAALRIDIKDAPGGNCPPK
jgi:hypothetical protein